MPMGMENTTNNAVSEQINNNQQNEAIDKDHLGPEHHPCRFGYDERRGNIDILIVSHFVMMTILKVDLHNNQL